MMFRTPCCMVVAASLVLASMGCARAPTIVGTWKDTTQAFGIQDAAMTFRSDGTGFMVKRGKRQDFKWSPDQDHIIIADDSEPKPVRDKYSVSEDGAYLTFGLDDSGRPWILSRVPER